MCESGPWSLRVPGLTVAGVGSLGIARRSKRTGSRTGGDQSKLEGRVAVGIDPFRLGGECGVRGSPVLDGRRSSLRLSCQERSDCRYGLEDLLGSPRSDRFCGCGRWLATGLVRVVLDGQLRAERCLDGKLVAGRE